MEAENYKTIKSSSKGVYKEKGSRFLAFAFPVESADEVKPLLDGLRKEYHDARHHCYAYMIGHERLTWRVNDDGEPSGTAGRPILGQINSAGITNVLIVVCRYFGGTLLGVSGLINAYRTAAAEALQNAEIIERTLNDYYEIKFPYTQMNEVMKILKEENAGQRDQEFGLECSEVIYFKVSRRDRVLNRLARLSGVSFSFIGTR